MTGGIACGQDRALAEARAEGCRTGTTTGVVAASYTLLPGAAASLVTLATPRVTAFGSE